MNGHYCQTRWKWCVCGCLMHTTTCECGCTIYEFDSINDKSPTRTGHFMPARTTHYEGRYGGSYRNTLDKAQG